MVRKLIDWALANPLIALLVAAALAVGGGYAFFNANIEAYPDPAPAIIEVVAQYPGASAEEVERQVTIPLEVALAGMPGLETTRSKSLFGLSHIRNQFNYSREYDQAKQDVLNRLAAVNLPPGASVSISPASPIGEIVRYTLVNPTDPATGKPVYTLNDLKAVQDYTLARELLRVDRIAGVTGVGGTVKRYEVHPDPEKLKQYGVTLAQVQAALGAANANGSGDNLRQGQQTVVVRSLGLIGGGRDPTLQVLTMTDPVEAAGVLRAEEARRCAEIRQVVIATVNNVPVTVDQIVDGPPALGYDGTPRVGDRQMVERGVVVGYQTRQGRVAISRPKQDDDGKPVRATDGTWAWDDEPDVVQGIVLLRKGKESMPALRDVLAKIDELNRPGRLPPGMKIAVFYNRSTLVDKTTETVHENLIVGMALVSAILLMFLGNVRAAVIVAINIPLALMFAFGVLFVRGKSANLLSIGAVDFGIIVDSSVIIVESIYRHLMAPGHEHETPAERIGRACASVTKSLLFATLIMVCALLPLFTMTGPEGQIFGPMADTYAFALAGALVLALVLSPVLCLLLMRRLKPKADNILVRGLQWLFVAQLQLLLKVRWLALILFVAVLAFTGVTAANMGREFMPELEEGNLMVRGTFPVSVSLAEVSGRAEQVRKVLQGFPEFNVLVSTIGRPDDGTDPTGYYNVETFIPMRPQEKWPAWIEVDWQRLRDMQVEEIRDKAARRRAGTAEGGKLAAAERALDAARRRQLTPEKPEEAAAQPLTPQQQVDVAVQSLVAAVPRPLTAEEQAALDEVLRCPTKEQLQDALQDFDLLMLHSVMKPEERAEEDSFLRLDSKEALLAHMPTIGRKVPGWWNEPRPKAELVKALNKTLEANFPGVDFDISQIIRDNVMEALSGVKGENSIKVFGPDLDTLEATAMKIRDTLNGVPGVQNAGVFRVQGQANLEFPVDRRKCKVWGVTPADVQTVIQSAVGGKPVSQVQEGERQFDLTLRWPGPLRESEEKILEIPVPVSNTVTPGNQVATPGSPVGSGGVGLSPTGSTLPPPSPTGNPNNVPPVTPTVSTVPLAALVTPLDAAGRPTPNGSFLRSGASTIYREQGQRLIAIKFEVRGRDLASTVAEARSKVDPMLQPPYRAEWSGEFKQMEAAEKRMAGMFAVSLVLIAVMLYLAFHSFLDAGVVFANVLAMGVGGVWALKIVGLNFNISAAVGFISILGVAVMNGLLFVSAMNGLRAKGVPLQEAVIAGTRQLVRPVVMTALAAILGLLPAAMSTKMGSESQRPLAVVVVGGMLFTILCLNLVPLLYSFYGSRTPPAGAGDMAH